MGNSSQKAKNEDAISFDNHISRVKVRQPYMSQMNLSNFVNNLSGRSFASAVSHQSTYSVSRPWSRVSRRRWHEATLNNPLEASKTAWPVTFVEALFLPEFKINGNVTEADFQVIDTIARGAFGKVFKVVKNDSHEEYALKILSKSKVISENAISQVKEEVGIQSMCGHNPFIVNCPFYWQNRQRLFIVTEYVPGGELFKLSQDYGCLPEELVQVYVAEIAFALDFLHNAGVIYRDLKLENIMLDSDGHIQLIDFGLAKWLKYGSRTSTICGTLLYMAPEVVSLQPYSHAVDWWSLGVVTCCLLSAQYPVSVVRDPNQPERNDDTSGGGEKVPGSLPDSWDFSPAARTLLGRLLERNPSLRLRSILKLHEQAFFKDFSFSDVRAKKITPQSILKKYFPNGPHSTMVAVTTTVHENKKTFHDFDSDFQDW